MSVGKLVVAACAALALPGVALAQHAGRHGSARHVGHISGRSPRAYSFGAPFAAGPVGRLGPRDLATWRAGYWWHGWRGGRVGWWWFAGGLWYWYPAPTHPYPDYVPGDHVGGGQPAPDAVWWYCDDPPGYYPYVQGCSRWRPTPPR